MSSGRALLFLSHLLIHLQEVGITIAQLDFLAHYCNYFGTEGNYTSNSGYRTNLDAIPSSISNSNNNYGFYNFSVGRSPDTVNVIGLCRGDVGRDNCVNCLNDSNTKLRQLCTNQMESIGWYENCMLRYSARSIFHIVETLPNAYAYNLNNASNVAQFNQVVRGLLDRLRVESARGSSTRKFATANATGPDNFTIYALAQCTPDLSGQQCNECLNGTAEVLPICCDGRIGGKVLRPSCNFRYEIGPFYGVTPADTPPLAVVPLPPSPPGKNDNSTKTVIIIVVSTVISVILLVCICIFIRKRKQRKTNRRKTKEKLDSEDVGEINSVESLQYDFNTIRVATDDFSDANKLGQGGFGSVYKGRLQNGLEIAVKRLSVNSGQGDLEFKNEVLLVAKLQHRNLVRLIGFCLEGIERLLVYEFVPNTSLDHFIFDREKRAYLDADCRCRIIGGVARGILYLHEDSRLRIIHRDLKASNVLLDAEMNPKISDFGMARLFELDETQGTTNRIVGTYGYMAPEYAMHGRFSVKSDVFSFGVLVLEILTGERNISFRHGEHVEDLLSYVWTKWHKGVGSSVIDPKLRVGSGSIRDIMRCIHIGLLCVQENIAHRPTMGTVVNMLSSSSLTLPVPLEPAFFMHSSIDPEMPLPAESSNSGATGSVNEASITELFPR